MNHRLTELRQEAQNVVEKTWFIKSLVQTDRTDMTLSFRLIIRNDLFIQVFYGLKSQSLYMALVEGRQRIYGIDREENEWHLHPFENPEQHEPLEQGLGPKPVMSFLARVEVILIENDLL